MSSGDYETLAEHWLTYSEREDDLVKQLSELKKAKRAIGDQLKNYMKTNGLDDLTTEKGTILFAKKMSKPSSCNKKTLKEGLDGLDWKKIQDAEQVTEQIFAKMPSKEHESLKRQKAKKEPKEPKEPKESKGVKQVKQPKVQKAAAK